MTRILIIDDDEMANFTLREILYRENYEVTAAKDGVEGAALFMSDPFPLVITDLLMPEKDGIGTIVESKKSCPDTKIIAITGGGRLNMAYLLSLARQFGADHVIAKPYGVDEVLECVKECLTS